MSETGAAEKMIATWKAEEEKRNKLLSYWCEFFSNLSYSPRQFYEQLARELEARKVAELEMEPVAIKQGGPFSSRRLYLQLRRERLVFEICGLPFADGFFVSERLYDRRRDPGLLDYLIVFILLSGTQVLAIQQVGLDWGLVANTGLVCLVWSLMRYGALDAVGSVDRVLSRLPAVGPLYDFFFHPETHYRTDTNNAYRKVVHGSLMHVLDEITRETGIRPMTEEQRRASVREPFQPSRS